MSENNQDDDRANVWCVYKGGNGSCIASKCTKSKCRDRKGTEYSSEQAARSAANSGHC